MQVEYRNDRLWTSPPPVKEFEIIAAQHLEDEVEFEHDVVDFCFIPKPNTEQIRCYVRLFDAESRAELTNGYGEVVIEEDSTDKKYISFADFGWLDEERNVPVSRCWYETWVDGESPSVWVEIFV
jgi:hypothetical protein